MGRCSVSTICRGRYIVRYMPRGGLIKLLLLLYNFVGCFMGKLHSIPDGAVLNIINIGLYNNNNNHNLINFYVYSKLPYHFVLIINIYVVCLFYTVGSIFVFIVVDEEKGQKCKIHLMKIIWVIMI